VGLVLAAILCGDARAYVGPQEAPSGESQVEVVEARAVAPVVEPLREMIYAPLEGGRARAPEPNPRYPSWKPPRMPGTATHEPGVARPRRFRSGRGLLIAGGVLAGTGFVLSSVALGAWFAPCSGFCEPYAAIFTSVAAPAPWLVGIGMLGGGMQHHSYTIASPGLAGGPVQRPRRGVYGAGLAMAIIGSGAIVGTWWAPPFSLFAQLGGGPLAVAGAMMAGAARGRRLAMRDHVSVVPVVTRTTAMLSLRMRW
jgi:hypothetical protein